MARSKRIVKVKEPVKLRTKALSDGNQSIYLDIYKDGARHYEFLKLYLIPEIDRAARIQNENTMRAANAIKAQRVIDIANGKADIKKKKAASSMLLSDFMQYYCDQKEKSGQSHSHAATIAHTRRHLLDYKGKKTRLQDVDKTFCEGFIEYLSSTKCFATAPTGKADGKTRKAAKAGKALKKTTAKLYYDTFICALNTAVRKGYMETNPGRLIDKDQKKPLRCQAATRDYLTIEELKALIATDCKQDAVKRAFLFGCFCGLRISDIRSLTWSMLQVDRGQLYATKTMVKTQKNIVLPISNRAAQWLPERGSATGKDYIFGDLPLSNSVLNYDLKIWAKTAGIDKYICFHMSRHTFATTALTLGADLYTTSKLLGHSNVKTTQVYAEIVNQKKAEAVNLFDKI